MSHYAAEPTGAPYAPPPPASPDLPPDLPVASPGPGSGRGRRGMVIVVAAVVAFILLAAGGTVAYLRLRPAGGGGTVNGAAAPTTQPAPVVTVAPTTTPPFAGDLRTLLLPKPTLAKAEKGNPSTNGNVSLDQAVEFFGGDSATRTNLQELGFTRGASIGWFDTPKNYVLFISLFQFDTPAHAAEWLVMTQQAWAESDELESTAYFDGIQGGRWFIDKKTPGTKQQMHGLVHRGTIWVLMTVYYPTKPDVKVLAALVDAQYQRLPAE